MSMGAPPVGTVTSAVAFVLDGHAIASPGVTSFPVVAGDTVATAAGPAVLLFRDGSRVKLGENSSVEVDAAGADLKVVLLAGALDFKLIPGSHVRVMSLDALRNQSPNVNAASAAPKLRAHVSTSLGKPGFILAAGGSAVGLTAGFSSSFGNESALKVAPGSAASIVHVPPVSRHL